MGWNGRLGVLELATSGTALDADRVVAGRIAVLDEDGSELARWDWGSDRGDGVVGEITQTLRTLLAVGIPIAVYDAAFCLTILDRECRRRSIPPLVRPAPILDPLLLDHLLSAAPPPRGTLSSLATRYAVEPGSLAAGRLVIEMAGRDPLGRRAHELHDAQQELLDLWPVVPLADIRLIEDTQPLLAPPLRPSDSVPTLDFEDFTLIPPPLSGSEPPAEHPEPGIDGPLPLSEPLAMFDADVFDTDVFDTDVFDTGEVPPLADGSARARRIHVAAAIVTDSAGRAVVVRKRGTTGYMQPGGKIERGESALAALIRELDEELGLTVDVDQTEFLGSFEAPALNEPGETVRAEVFALTTDAELRPANEIDAIHWLRSPDDTHSVELAPLTLDVLLPLWALRRPALF